jgi:protein O-mannosyl-transferase
MPPAPPADGAPSERRLFPAVALLATCAAYANSLHAGFQFDDWNVVVRDPRVATLAAWWASMPGIRALLKLSYALDHAAGFVAPGFHATNVAIHLACVGVVYALFLRLARRFGADAAGARACAFAASLVFALHPVQTEAVTYVSGRSTALASALAAASVLAWIEGRERGLRWSTHVLSPALFLAALSVKETAVAVPAAILLCWATERNGIRSWKAAAGAIPVHLAVLAGAVAAAASGPTYRHLAATSFATRGVVANLATQAGAVFYLAGQIVRVDRLNADPMLAARAGWSLVPSLEALVLVALLAAGLFTIRKFPAAAFGVLWFFVWLAPTNSFVPRLDVVNDRQIYLALAGPAWLFAWGLGALPLPRRAALAIAATVGLLLGTATWARNRVYADEISFWADVVGKTPGNGRAWNNLGYACALEGRTAEAEADFSRALAIDPGDVRAAVNLRLLHEGGLVPQHEPSP